MSDPPEGKTVFQIGRDHQLCLTLQALGSRVPILASLLHRQITGLELLHLSVVVHAVQLRQRQQTGRGDEIRLAVLRR